MGASFVEVGHVIAVSKMDGRHLEGLQGAEGRDNSMQGLGEPNPGSTSQHCKWDFRDIVLLSFLKNSAFAFLRKEWGSSSNLMGILDRLFKKKKRLFILFIHLGI